MNRNLSAIGLIILWNEYEPLIRLNANITLSDTSTKFCSRYSSVRKDISVTSATCPANSSVSLILFKSPRVSSLLAFSNNISQSASMSLRCSSSTGKYSVFTQSIACCMSAGTLNLMSYFLHIAYVTSTESKSTKCCSRVWASSNIISLRGSNVSVY